MSANDLILFPPHPWGFCDTTGLDHYPSADKNPFFRKPERSE